MANLESYKNVWVFAEQRQGKLMNVALELVGEGHKLSREISDKQRYAQYLSETKLTILQTNSLPMVQTVFIFWRMNCLRSTRQTAMQKR